MMEVCVQFGQLLPQSFMQFIKKFFLHLEIFKKLIIFCACCTSQI